VTGLPAGEAEPSPVQPGRGMVIGPAGVPDSRVTTEAFAAVARRPAPALAVAKPPLEERPVNRIYPRSPRQHGPVSPRAGRQAARAAVAASAPAPQGAVHHAPLEPLEDRRLLSVSLDAQGWTNVAPSADTRVVY